MKTQYFISTDKKLSVKETEKFIYTRVLNRFNAPIEVKHSKDFFNTLKGKYNFKACTQFQFLTVTAD